MRVFPYAVKVRWGGLRVEPYESNPVDADADGIVQEGTIWERPLGARMLDRLGKEIASGINPPSGDPFDFSAREGMRIVDADGKDLDYTPTWEKGGLVPDVTRPADSSIGGGGKRTVGEMSGTVGEITSGLSPAEQEQSRMQREAAENAAADLAESEEQVGTDRGGKPLEHDLYVPPTPEESAAMLEGVAGAREALARGADPELTGGVPDPAAEGTAHEDIVWDEAGRKWDDLTEEERAYLWDVMLEAIADRGIARWGEAANDGKLKEPTGEESRILRAIREKYPRLQELRTKAEQLLTLGRQPSYLDIPDGLGKALGAKAKGSMSPELDRMFPISPTPPEKEKHWSKDFFYKMHALSKKLWGGTSLGVSENILRDGIDDPESGRRIVFVGKEPDLSADVLGDEHLLVLDGVIPLVGGEYGSYADFYDGTMLPSTDVTEARDAPNGRVVTDTSMLIPDLDVEMDLDDPNADIPMELVYLAIRKRMEEKGSHAAQDNAVIELAKEVRSVGQLFMAAVNERYNKLLKTLGDKKLSRLSEFFGRNVGERLSLAEVEARELSEHARRILQFDADHFDDLHITQPEVARALNEAMRRAVIRVLGYEPEWTRTDRSTPVDPEATVEQSAARARADVPGGAPDWEIEDAAWNGSPEYLFKGLIRELVGQYETSDMTEEEFLKKLENLDDEIVAAFEEELEIEISPEGGKPRTVWSELSMHELRAIRTLLFVKADDGDPAARGDTLDGLLTRTGRRELNPTQRTNAIEAMVTSGGMTREFADDLLELLAGDDEETLREFLEELEFRTIWSPSILEPGKAFTPSPMIGGTWLEVGYRNALADATRMDGPDGRVGILQELRESGRLSSVVTTPSKRQIAIQLLRELLEHGDADEIKAALRGDRTGSEERLAELVELDATGILSYEDRFELTFLKLKTAAELEGTFDHVQVTLGREGISDADVLENRLKSRAAIKSPRTGMTPDSDAHVVYNENLERLERVVEAALRFVPLRVVRKLGLLGPTGIQTHSRTGGSLFEAVIRAGQRWAQPHDGGYQSSKPFGGTVTHLPADTDEPTALHEIVHALVMGDPVANELLMAYLTLATGTEEDGLRGWNKFIKPMSEAGGHRSRGIAGGDTGEYFVDIEGHEGFTYSHRAYVDRTDPYLRENVSQLVGPDNQLDLQKVADFYDEHEKYDRGRVRFVPSELVTMVMDSLISPDAYSTLDLWDGTDTSLAEYIFGLLLTIG